MCLAAAGKIVELKQQGKIAVVLFGKEKRELPNVIGAKKGQLVLVQQGMVVEKIEA